ncbi:hypothetical protein HDV00_004955 [Rhizophlyctis rosea]|nr:hypothetical protein HDV00_004955 [Rhizophlyctis rosea]
MPQYREAFIGAGVVLAVAVSAYVVCALAAAPDPKVVVKRKRKSAPTTQKRLRKSKSVSFRDPIEQDATEPTPKPSKRATPSVRERDVATNTSQKPKKMSSKQDSAGQSTAVPLHGRTRNNENSTDAAVMSNVALGAEVVAPPPAPAVSIPSNSASEIPPAEESPSLRELLPTSLSLPSTKAPIEMPIAKAEAPIIEAPEAPTLETPVVDGPVAKAPVNLNKDTNAVAVDQSLPNSCIPTAGDVHDDSEVSATLLVTILRSGSMNIIPTPIVANLVSVHAPVLEAQQVKVEATEVTVSIAAPVITASTVETVADEQNVEIVSIHSEKSAAVLIAPATKGKVHSEQVAMEAHAEIIESKQYVEATIIAPAITASITSTQATEHTSETSNPTTTEPLKATLTPAPAPPTIKGTLAQIRELIADQIEIVPRRTEEYKAVDDEDDFEFDGVEVDSAEVEDAPPAVIESAPAASNGGKKKNKKKKKKKGKKGASVSEGSGQSSNGDHSSDVVTDGEECARSVGGVEANGEAVAEAVVKEVVVEEEATMQVEETEEGGEVPVPQEVESVVLGMVDGTVSEVVTDVVDVGVMAEEGEITEVAEADLTPETSASNDQSSQDLSMAEAEQLAIVTEATAELMVSELERTKEVSELYDLVVESSAVAGTDGTGDADVPAIDSTADEEVAETPGTIESFERQTSVIEEHQLGPGLNPEAAEFVMSWEEEQTWEPAQQEEVFDAPEFYPPDIMVPPILEEPYIPEQAYQYQPDAPSFDLAAPEFIPSTDAQPYLPMGTLPPSPMIPHHFTYPPSPEFFMAPAPYTAPSIPPTTLSPYQFPAPMFAPPFQPHTTEFYDYDPTAVQNQDPVPYYLPHSPPPSPPAQIFVPEESEYIKNAARIDDQQEQQQQQQQNHHTYHFTSPPSYRRRNSKSHTLNHRSSSSSLRGSPSRPHHAPHDITLFDFVKPKLSQKQRKREAVAAAAEGVNGEKGEEVEVQA